MSRLFEGWRFVRRRCSGCSGVLFRWMHCYESDHCRRTVVVSVPIRYGGLLVYFETSRVNGLNLVFIRAKSVIQSDNHTMTFEGALTSYKLVAAHFWASHRLERTIAIRQPVPWKHGNGQVAPAVGLLRVCRCRVACACTFVYLKSFVSLCFFFVFSLK